MSSNPHFIGKISLRAIIVRGNKILLNRDSDDKDIWELPGGRLHIDEAPETGLQREILEELGVEINPGAVVYVEQFKQTRTKEPSFMVTYKATLKDPSAPFVFRDGEVAEIKWITKEQLFDQKIYDNCLNALKTYFSKNKLD